MWQSFLKLVAVDCASRKLVILLVLSHQPTNSVSKKNCVCKEFNTLFYKVFLNKCRKGNCDLSL